MKDFVAPVLFDVRAPSPFEKSRLQKCSLFFMLAFFKVNGGKVMWNRKKHCWKSFLNSSTVTNDISSFFMSPVTSVTFILAKPGLSPPDRQLPDQQPTADRNSCDLTYLYIYIYYIYIMFFFGEVASHTNLQSYLGITSSIWSMCLRNKTLMFLRGWLYLLVPSLVFNLAPQGKLPPIPRDVLQASRWRSLLFHLLGVAPSTFTTVYKKK